MPAFSGGCHCGAVNYRGDADPVFTGNCHCTDCRKLSPTGHASWMAVPAASLEITGDAKGYSMTADSGATVTHHFCPTCGSQVYNTNTNMGGMRVIAMSTLDDPEMFKPQISVYTSSAISWDPPSPDLPKFEKMPPMDG